MPDRAVYLLVVEGFADWEPAHAVAELRRHGQYRVEVVGLASAPIRSMGGISVLPSTTVTQVDAADVAAFILPGGDRWESSPIEPELEQLLKPSTSPRPTTAISTGTTRFVLLDLIDLATCGWFAFPARADSSSRIASVRAVLSDYSLRGRRVLVHDELQLMQRDAEEGAA